MEQQELLNLYNELKEEETKYVFEKFGKEDALTLGLKLVKLARIREADMAIAVTVNGTVWFSCLVGNATKSNVQMVERKRNTVELMEMSSYRYGLYLQLRGQTLEDRGLSAADYTDKGGGFPIRIRDTGVIGTVCVSGLPHAEDHTIIAEALRDILHIA